MGLTYVHPKGTQERREQDSFADYVEKIEEAGKRILSIPASNGSSKKRTSGKLYR